MSCNVKPSRASLYYFLLDNGVDDQLNFQKKKTRHTYIMATTTVEKSG